MRASFDPRAIAADAGERDAARKRAAALEARYAPWYYVISGESVERLRLTRQMLVKRAG